MHRAPDIANESGRMAALHALQILDTPPEESFDRFTRLASRFFQVPIALVSLVDSNRQWFKSCYGLDVRETPRDISFCGHAILQDQTFVVENALEDPRFADNPLVSGDPQIRFYAGQPLRAGDGSLVGTFCLIDRKPRTFSAADRAALVDFARLVETELNLANLTDLNQKLVQSRLQEKKAQDERDRMFTHSLDLQCVARLDGRFSRVNPMFSKVLGYSEEELLATPFIEFVHPDDRQATLDAMSKLSAGGSVEQFENRYRCKNGSYRWLEWSTPAPVGEDQLLFAVARDITEQKIIENALRQSEARFKSLFDHSPEAIVLLDLKSGKFVDVNQNALDLFGIDRDRALQCGPLDLSPQTQPNGRSSEEVANEKINEALWGKLPVFEWVHSRADGTIVPCEVRLVPLPGNPPMVRASITDITWRKRAEEELRQAKEAAESANRAKSDFLANMSHEIRTPMNAIIGMTELVLDMELSDVQREYLETALQSAESLMTIINEILDFSKIEAGKLQLEEQPFSLRECLGDTLKSLAHRAHSSGLELAWHVDETIPDRLVGDAARLRQVVVNLVGNSIKFTERGEVFVNVSPVAVAADRVEVRFSVRDTGIGIAADRLETVFEAFRQADASTTRKFGGTGLGLAICSRLINLMQGRIWVESELGRGSEFLFTCRFARAAELESAPDLSALRNVRVLVVDDNATNRMILAETLTKWGMEVAQVSSADQALSQLEDSAIAPPVSLVISDLHMPGKDGFDLARAIRQSPTHGNTPMILLTSGPRHDQAELCQELEIVRDLLKPVKQSELLAAVQTALGIRRPAKSSRIGSEAKSMDEIGPLRILLVEDGIANQKLAVGLLNRWGHHVTVAGDGRQAIESLDRERFDLVLMDVQMPELDGMAATRIIREREKQTGRHTPIIAMTARAMAGDREQCLNAGMDGYLAKPVRKKELYEALRGISPVLQTPVEEPPPAQAQSKSASAAGIDWENALAVVDGDEEMLREIAEIARDELARLIDALQQAVRDRAAPEVRRITHTIQGTFRVFRNDRATELLREFEDRGREEKFEGIDDRFRQLSEILKAVQADLSAHLAAE